MTGKVKHLSKHSVNLYFTTFGAQNYCFQTILDSWAIVADTTRKEKTSPVVMCTLSLSILCSVWLLIDRGNSVRYNVSFLHDHYDLAVQNSARNSAHYSRNMVSPHYNFANMYTCDVVRITRYPADISECTSVVFNSTYLWIELPCLCWAVDIFWFHWTPCKGW